VRNLSQDLLIRVPMHMGARGCVVVDDETTLATVDIGTTMD
jgi:hypothetical protein